MGQQRIAPGLGGIGAGHGQRQQNGHSGEQRPALLLVADHVAQHDRQRERDRQIQPVLQDAGPSRRIFKRMCRVGVEEPATIGAEFLDRLLPRDRAVGDGLRGAFERMRGGVAGQRFRHASDQQYRGSDDADRQQQIQRAARQIDPEITQRLQPARGKGADHGNRGGNAGRGAEEIMDRQPDHLRAVGNLAFRRIGLPIRVGDEADGSIERQARRHGRDRLRVPRQHILQAQNGIEHQEMQRVQKDQRADIRFPAHALLRVDAGNGIYPTFDRAENRRQENRFVGEQRRHIGADGERGGEYERQRQGDFRPACHCHRDGPLEIFRADQRPYEVQQKQRGHRAAGNQIQHVKCARRVRRTPP